MNKFLLHHHQLVSFVYIVTSFWLICGCVMWSLSFDFYAAVRASIRASPTICRPLHCRGKTIPKLYSYPPWPYQNSSTILLLMDDSCVYSLQGWMNIHSTGYFLRQMELGKELETCIFQIISVSTASGDMFLAVISRFECGRNIC